MTFETARTKAKPNGKDEVQALKADMYNLTQLLDERHKALEQRIDAKLDDVLQKLDTLLQVIELQGQQAQMLRKR